MDNRNEPKLDQEGFQFDQAPTRRSTAQNQERLDGLLRIPDEEKTPQNIDEIKNLRRKITSAKGAKRNRASQKNMLEEKEQKIRDLEIGIAQLKIDIQRESAENTSLKKQRDDHRKLLDFHNVPLVHPTPVVPAFKSELFPKKTESGIEKRPQRLTPSFTKGSSTGD